MTMHTRLIKSDNMSLSNFITSLLTNTKDFLNTQDILNCLCLNKQIRNELKSELFHFIFSNVSNKFTKSRCDFITSTIKVKYNFLEQIKLIDNNLNLNNIILKVISEIYDFILLNLNFIKSQKIFISFLQSSRIRLISYRTQEHLFNNKKYDLLLI